MHEDKFYYSLEKIRIEALTAISLIPQFIQSLDQRHQKSKIDGKNGFYVLNDEFECGNTSCIQIQATLMTCYELLIRSARQEKEQTRILEKSLEDYIVKDLRSLTEKKSA